jgi:hypothetical protein
MLTELTLCYGNKATFATEVLLSYCCREQRDDCVPLLNGERGSDKLPFPSKVALAHVILLLWSTSNGPSSLPPVPCLYKLFLLCWAHSTHNPIFLRACIYRDIVTFIDCLTATGAPPAAKRVRILPMNQHADKKSIYSTNQGSSCNLTEEKSCISIWLVIIVC